MIYTALTVKAARIAYAAHQGQTDRSGLPYIFHPYHLAEQMEDEACVCAALLHDVVEDTHVTLGDLEQEFPPEVTRAVALLTRDRHVPYDDYIRALKGNPIARRVKLADIAHNSDESRLVGCDVSPAQMLHWRDKYARARAILEGDEP